MPVFALLAIVVVGTIALATRKAAGKGTPAEPEDEIDFEPEELDDEPHESDIPWRSDAWTWEIYVEEDGTVVDEVGDELRLEDGLVPIEVCPGDTIVLRVAPGLRRQLLAFMLPPVSWLTVSVNAPEEGDFAWQVRAPKADSWRPTELGVYDRRYGAHARRFGFAVAIAESCE